MTEKVRPARVRARDLWRVLEPFHQLSYRSAEGVASMGRLGLDRPDLQYFGARLCAAGPVSAPLATALVFGHAPDLVARAVPEVWRRAAPEQVLVARVEAADATLRRVLREEELEQCAEVAPLARRAASVCAWGGHPMAAAHLDHPWPEEPHLELWWACTVLREHRGDAHWACTTAAGVDPTECHVLASANGYLPAGMLSRHTGWEGARWEAAVARLVGRGLVVDDGEATAEGEALKESIEHGTDRLAEQPLAVLDAGETQALHDLLTRCATQILDAGEAQPWRLREAMWREPRTTT